MQFDILLQLIANGLVMICDILGMPLLGLLGTKPSWDLMQDCDTLLMVGSSFPYSEFPLKPGTTRGMQIDINGRIRIRGRSGDGRAEMR